MKKPLVALIACCTLSATLCAAQDVYQPWRKSWLDKAVATTPELTTTVKSPARLVRIRPDEAGFQGWRVEDAGSVETLYASPLNANNGVVVDFGDHITGHYTFKLEATEHVPDAPVRLKFTFGEVPSELAVPLDPYPGLLSRAWMQDETVTADVIPGTFTIPRRVSFRYVKIELVGSYYDFRLTDMYCKATTSVTSWPEPLPPTTDPVIRRINEVGLNTLKECMQTVYEDGPKRDQRLWIGDLYLEALANTQSFKQHALTKHCLYVLAALAAEDGLLHASVMERPELHPQTGTHIVDYSLLYNVALLDYVKTTGDLAVAEELWPVVGQQIAFARKYLDADYIYNPKKDKPIWIFFDWADELDRHVPIQGAMIYSLDKSAELASMLGKQAEAREWQELAVKMKKAIRKACYDKRKGVFLSGPDKQVSHLSQVWMVLSNTLSPKEGAKALEYILSDATSVYPRTPYAYHYLIEALIQCGMHKEARENLKSYWGGMLDKGADTFWEVYDPNDDFRAPYNFHPVNSYCHAWSCTPVYFINKYPEIFIDGQ